MLLLLLSLWLLMMMKAAEASTPWPCRPTSSSWPEETVVAASVSFLFFFFFFFFYPFSLLFWQRLLLLLLSTDTVDDDGWRLFKVLDHRTPFFTFANADEEEEGGSKHLAKTHHHIAKQIMNSAFRKVVTASDRRCIAFRCIRCRNPFREQVQKLVQQGRAACDSCCGEP